MKTVIGHRSYRNSSAAVKCKPEKNKYSSLNAIRTRDFRDTFNFTAAWSLVNDFDGQSSL